MCGVHFRPTLPATHAYGMRDNRNQLLCMVETNANSGNFWAPIILGAQAHL